MLDPGSKKHTCPDCGKNTLVRYIDTTTGEYLPPNFGRCDREANCSYHERPPLETKCFFVPFNSLNNHSEKAFKITTDTGVYYLPKSQVYEILEKGCFVAAFILESDGRQPQHLTNETKYFAGEQVVSIVTNQEQPPKQDPVFIPVEVLNETLQAYDQNIFIQNLLTRVPFPFDGNQIEKVISLYYLGTVATGYRDGAITFPFIDQVGNIRAIQVKQFNESNHTTGTDFLHSIVEKHHTRNNSPFPEWLEGYQHNEKKVSCLFGEHLLNKYPLNPVALVEAPKTAIYGSLYFGFPDDPANLLWLAVYNLSSLTLEKCKVLQGRDVVLFPDLSKDGKAFDLWSDKANEFNKQIPGTRFIVSDLLERNATDKEREKGLDLADYLINQDWHNFQPQPTEDNEPEIFLESAKSAKSEPSKTNYSFTKKQTEAINWDNEIKELEDFFSKITFPGDPIRLNPCSVVTDPDKFINYHLSTLRHYNGNPAYMIELKQIQDFKAILNTNIFENN